MRVALISCVKTKSKSKNMAKDLYISPLFKMNYTYAKQNCDKVFILSAKHGLLEETEVIEPYEQTLSKMKKIDRIKWADDVTKQLSAKNDLAKDEFMILAGKNYREFLLPNIRNYTIPFEGRSFGKQLQQLKERINGHL